MEKERRKGRGKLQGNSLQRKLQWNSSGNSIVNDARV